MRLIQGVFFQRGQGLGIGYDDIGEAAVFVHEGLLQTMFAGLIVDDPNNAVGGLVGFMQDASGFSRLDNVRCNELELSFCKRYTNRDDPINYKFTVHKDGQWFGTYEGPRVGKGLCRCVITEVPDDFQDPKDVMAALGTKTAH